jgi:hypothetical protein
VILRYSFSDPIVGACSSRRTAAAILPTQATATTAQRCLVSELGGPRVYEVAELVTSCLQARGMAVRSCPSGFLARPPARSEPVRISPAPGCGPPDLGGLAGGTDKFVPGQHIGLDIATAHIEGIA